MTPQTSNDIGRLASLHAECFPGKPWPAAEFSSLLKSGAEIIASDNGFIVWRAAVGEAEIITLGVRPQMRRGGLGSAMLALMEKDLRAKSVVKIFLEVAADNSAAIRLYEKNGFAKIASRRGYYDGIDAVVMEKSLP